MTTALPATPAEPFRPEETAPSLALRAAAWEACGVGLEIRGANGARIEANAAARASSVPNYPAIEGQDLFGFGWDIDTAFSRPRGTVFPIGSFGGTGFTGTSLWIDPGSDTYVILLSNCILIRGSSPITDLRGEVATAAARALNLDDGGAPRR